MNHPRLPIHVKAIKAHIADWLFKINEGHVTPDDLEWQIVHQWYQNEEEDANAVIVLEMNIKGEAEHAIVTATISLGRLVAITYEFDSNITIHRVIDQDGSTYPYHEDKAS